MVGHQGSLGFVSLECLTCQSLINVRGVRTLLKSAENLQWPMPIDYIAANPESRDEFERSFINLLKLQEMYVVLIFAF